MSYSFLNKTDYTLLDVNASNQSIKELCEKARQYNVYSVCVMPVHVSLARKELRGSTVLVCTVISFPSGLNSLNDKMNETIHVCEEGADEVDLVMNYSLLEDSNYILEELSSIKKVCDKYLNTKKEKVVLKVIVESGMLSIQQTKVATELCIRAKVNFIKTSTGKVAVGAEMDKIKAMEEVINRLHSSLRIKASGGIRTYEQILDLNPLVDRFGIGYATVDQIVMGATNSVTSSY